MSKAKAMERIARVAPALIDANPLNPRVIDERGATFKAFVENVKAMGVKVHVRLRASAEKPGRYELLAGERRVRAAKAADLADVPAIVSEGLTDDEAFDILFAENFGREDLTPLEEGNEVETLLQKFKGDAKAVAVKLGRTEQWVATRARLKRLTKSWLKALGSEDSPIRPWTVSHLVLVARFSEAQQEEIFNALPDAEAPLFTPKNLDKWINEQMLRRLDKAAFDIADAGLDPKAGACAECAKRASCQGKLFIEAEAAATRKKQDQCTDRSCWERKELAALKRTVEELKAKHGAVLVFAPGVYGAERAAVEQAFGKRDEQWKFAEAKESGKDAFPGVTVTGRERGMIAFYKPTSSESSGARGKKEPGTPTPLAERRKILAGRRWALVLKELQEKLDAATSPVGTAENRLGALAAAFGTEHNSRDLYARKNVWETFEKFQADNEATADALWKQVKPVLIHRLTAWGPVSNVGEELQSEARNAAELIGADLDAMLTKATEEIPEPKSWAHLNADGTVKTTGKKGKGK